MSPTKTTTLVTTESKLAAEINLLNEQVISSRNQTLIYAARAGAKMLEAKELVGHGKFIKWLEQNCTISRQYAANYMRLANEYPQLVNDDTNVKSTLHLLDVTKAIALISASDEVKDTVMLKLENGETVTVADIKQLKQNEEQLTKTIDTNAELTANLNAKQAELDSLENQLEDLLSEGGIDKLLQQKEAETQIIIGEMVQRQDHLTDQISRLKNEQNKIIETRVSEALAKKQQDIAALEAKKQQAQAELDALKTNTDSDFLKTHFKKSADETVNNIQQIWDLIERYEQSKSELDKPTVKQLVIAANECKMLAAKLEDIASHTLENVT